MADFIQDMQSFKPSQPFPEMGFDLDFASQFAELNPILLENFNATEFSLETLLGHQQQPEFPTSFDHTFSGTSPSDGLNAVLPVAHAVNSIDSICHESRKTKIARRSSENIPSAASENGFTTNTSIKRKNSLGKGNKGRKNDKAHKPEEVVHVRAGRGQATDSHSLAERVRRAKINNKLRCLQDIVPGCCESMGMATMLDEIINYVHSLQNQVEFLSMELASASCLHGFNLKQEIADDAQGTGTHEALGIEKMEVKEYGEGSCFQLTTPF